MTAARLVVVAPDLEDGHAGRGLLELVEHAVREEGVAVTVLAWRGGPLEGRLDAVADVTVVDRLRRWTPAALAERGLARVGMQDRAGALRRRRLGVQGLDDVVAVHLTSPRAAAALRFLPGLGPVVTSVSGDELTAVDPHLLNDADLDLLLERTDRFLVAREASWTYLVGRLGVAPNRLRWSAARLVPSRPAAPSDERLAELRRQLDVPPAAPVVVGQGPREWSAGTDLYLRVAWLVHQDERTKDVRFLWVGPTTDPFEAKQLDHDRRQMGLADHLTFLDADGADAVWLADLQLVTSRDETEQPIYEPAASRSTAFVAFSSDLLERFVAGDGDDAPAGVLVDFLDLEAMAKAVIELVVDEDQRKAIGARGGARFGAWHAGDERSPRLYAEISAG